MRRFVGSIVLSLLGYAALPCACLYPDGGDVRFADQRNIIVWDPETKMQHFVRIAGFVSEAKDMGFVAPTPSVPELAEVEERSFEVESAVFKKYAKAQRDASLVPSIGCSAGELAPASAVEGAVEILQDQDVGGYRAVTLRARDSKGFRKWLDEHKFITTPSMDQWIKFYMDKDWVFTAFLVKGNGETAETSPVRMSFKTEKPYSPYYVPSDNHPKQPANLSVAFYAPGQYDSIGTKAGRREVAPVTEEHAEELKRTLGLKTLPKDLALVRSVYFEFPRPSATDDLFFERTGATPSWPVNLNPAKPYVFGGIIAFFVARKVIKNRRERL
jgi:hypothetical protein